MNSQNAYYAMLEQWKETAEEIERLKSLELDLRKKLFAGAFPQPEEGIQRVTLTDGTILKGTFRLNRKINAKKLADVELPEAIKNRVIRQKPELDLKMYRTLTEADRQEFDRCLTITPGTPALEIEEKREKK